MREGDSLNERGNHHLLDEGGINEIVDGHAYACNFPADISHCSLSI